MSDRNYQKLNDEVFVDNKKYDPDLLLDWATSPAGEEYFTWLVSDPESLCLVAENENHELVGYLAASPKEISYRRSKYLEIDNMGVTPAFRSQGLGTMLLKACKDWAKHQGYDKLFVNTYTKNTGAMSFYEKSGFEPIDISLEMTL